MGFGYDCYARDMSKRVRLTTVWLLLFTSVLLGIGVAKLFGAPRISSALLISLLVFAVIRRTVFWAVLVVVFGVLLGINRGVSIVNSNSGYQKLYKQEVVVWVTARDDASYNKYKQMSFGAGEVIDDNGQRLPGKLLVSGFGANAIFQGDNVEVLGKLYPGYGTYLGRINYAKLRVVSHHPSTIASLRRNFVAAMQSVLPEPLASFAMGLLVGQRATLPESVKQDLLMVGLTHIIAVSGYNLTIILQASHRVLGSYSKRLSTAITFLLMMLFLMLAGSSASIIRAAIVSTLSISAAYYGRTFKPLNLIIFAALITAWANPLYIWSDLSWYLSFLAFFGVMALAPLLQVRLPFGRQNVIMGVALESICAEIMTLPFILYNFGQMSRVGLLANVLVVILIPLAMLLSLIAGLAGMLCGTVAGWFSWPATQLLNYMLDISHFLSHLPKVFVQELYISPWQMVFLYSLILVICVVLYQKRPKSSTITDISNQKIGSLMS